MQQQAADAATSAAEMAALMTRVAAGDREAFVTVFEHFAPRVKSFLQGRGADSTLADDLMQEVMVTVWRKASGFDPAKAQLSTWIFTIARNKHVDHLRRPGGRTEQENPAQESASGAPSLEEEAMLAQLAGAVQKALRALPQEQRSVTLMSFFHGLSHAEISHRLGLPLGTVKSRLRLSFERLRSQLGAQQ